MIAYSRQFQRFLSLISIFFKSRDGALPVFLALALLPGLALIGMAVDFAGAQSNRSKLQAAADAAVLMTLKSAEQLEATKTSTKDFTEASTTYPPIARGVTLFETLAAEYPGVQGAKITITLERKANVFTATGNFTGLYKTMMPNIQAVSLVEMSGLATSTLSVSNTGYIEIHTLLDTSGSMGIGASEADIAALEAWKEGPHYNHIGNVGCAFSCHGEKPAGVQLRVDVLRDAVIGMIDSAAAQARSTPSEPARVKIALNRFDQAQHKLHDLSTNYTSLRTAAEGIRLQAYDAYTRIGSALEWITPLIPESGNGLSADTPRRFLFLVTDGLEDRWIATPAPPINFVAPYGYDPTGPYQPEKARPRTGTVDTAFCDRLKAKKITVVVLNTTHIGIYEQKWKTGNPMSDYYGQWWFPPQPQIKPRLQACASDGFFFEGKDAAELKRQFEAMFTKALSSSSARLSR